MNNLITRETLGTGNTETNNEYLMTRETLGTRNTEINNE
jgi:hypothetical protein